MRNFNLAYISSIHQFYPCVKHPRYTTLGEVKSVAEVFKHQVEAKLHQHNKKLILKLYLNKLTYVKIYKIIVSFNYLLQSGHYISSSAGLAANPHV